jgi:hypothetical protein
MRPIFYLSCIIVVETARTAGVQETRRPPRLRVVPHAFYVDSAFTRQHPVALALAVPSRFGRGVREE